MKTEKTMKCFPITPCDSGFGEWEPRLGSREITVGKGVEYFPRHDLDGHVKNQRGDVVEIPGYDMVACLYRD